MYLNGGPQNANGPGLPEGLYYFQVTDPSGGTLLSTDNAVCRQLQVVGGAVAGAAGPCFSGGNKKTDNFKVDQDGGSPTENEISGTKFYDANVNGTQDAGEPGIPGWQIEIDIPSNTTTDADGNYIFLNVPDSTYEVGEVIPSLAPTWLATTPTSISGITVPPDSPNNDFGNVCLGPGGGKTLGFWSNKNGEKIITANGLHAVCATCGHEVERNHRGCQRRVVVVRPWMRQHRHRSEVHHGQRPS